MYDEGPWWRDGQNTVPLTGAIMSTKMPNVAQNEDAVGPLTCMDHGVYSDNVGVLMCWIEGEVNNQFYATLDTEAQKEYILNYVSESFDDPRVTTPGPSQVIEHNWADQPYVKGAYTGFFSPGAQSSPASWSAYLGGDGGLGEKAPALPNLFVAGADWWPGFGNGYIEGAVRVSQGSSASPPRHQHYPLISSMMPTYWYASPALTCHWPLYTPPPSTFSTERRWLKR